MIAAFDIDGVLADPRPFLYIIPDWKEYYKHTLELEPIYHSIKVLHALHDSGHFIYIVTGRNELVREETEKWIHQEITIVMNTILYPNHKVPIIMRPDGDFRHSHEYKLSIYKMIRPSLIFEDDPETVKVCRENNFNVMQVFGYRGNSTNDGIPFKE